jgi:cyclophilin family peptidyl-prolyl cis-trans isomerase
VGWNWGGKDRCDASDPQCGPDGKLRGEIVGKSVPPEISQITCVAVIRIDVGREESGVLRLGFYGKDAPASVEQLASFLSEGLETLASNGNRLGSTSIPVSLTCGGVIDTIVPGSVVDFGVPSQTFAYGRSRGMSRVDNFVVQPRPKATATAGDKSVRSHDAAGLVSVSLKGLGYGGTGFESDDEAFESSFLITADAVPSLDKTRRVVGQVLDASSMAFLERLASLPTKRGIRGVIPGQTSGPPLLKTVVREVAVSRVTDPSLSS